ncbi:MAG: hypothetical protein WCS17_12810 [Prevotella sp.]
MKGVVYVFVMALLVTACRSSQCSVDQMRVARYDSIMNVLKEVREQNRLIEIEKKQVVDSMRRIKLPAENSKNVLPAQQYSQLYTSLAESAAWVDSIGLLHHHLQNKDSAALPARHEVSEKILISDIKTQETDKKELNVSSSDISKEVIKVPVRVPVERFLGRFFYLSGWMFWLAGLIICIWYMQIKTPLKPISIFLKWIKKLI